MKRKLSNITLIAIDCINLERTIFAANECLKHTDFGAVKILTSLDTSNFNFDNMDFVEIPVIKSKVQYSNFIIRELDRYVDTDYCLLFQWDGFIVNPDMWSDLFLNYDYIGAPWIISEGEVGNGGFSLRSKNLLKALASIPNEINTHPEDIFINKFCKQFKNFKLAPAALAGLFSCENREYDGAFGFHDFSCIQINKWRELMSSNHNKSAVHSGDAGDIIYCIPALKALGVNKLTINIRGDFGTKITKTLAERLKPLLESQGFETTVQLGYNPVEYDYLLDSWRKGSDLTNIHLAISQATAHKAKINFYENYIRNITPNPVADVVVNWTPRYPNPEFDWKYILSGINEPIAFIGLKQEFEDFKRIGRNDKLFHHETSNYLQVAEVIAGAKIFIGSPSSPFAIAEGLKGKRILSVCPIVPGVTAWDTNDNAVNVNTMSDLIIAKHKLMRLLYDK